MNEADGCPEASVLNLSMFEPKADIQLKISEYFSIFSMFPKYFLLRVQQRYPVAVAAATKVHEECLRV